MHVCLEFHPQPIRQSTAYKRLKKGRKYFQDIVKELEKAGLIVRQNKYYFYIPAHFVRKLSGGVSNPFKNSLGGLSLDNQFLTMQESYNQHALFGTYFHDYPEHLWEKLRGMGSWEAEDYSMKRFVFDPLYTYFEDVQFTVKMFRHVLEIYCPVVSEKDPNNRAYKDVTISKVGRFAQWFAEKRLSKGKLKVNIKEDKVRFHETNRTYLFQEIANKFYQQGTTKVLTNDWGIDFSKDMPEFEAFQKYVMVDREGIGSDLVDEALHFPRFFVESYLPYQTQLVQSIQQNIQQNFDVYRTGQESVNQELVKNLKLMNDNLVEHNKSNNRDMTNISVFLDNLATKEDIEILHEAVQKLSLRAEKLSEKRVYVNLDSKCQKILKELSGGALTRSELALLLGVSDTAPLTQIRKLLAAELIKEETIETGEVGRPKTEYKLKESENYGK